jgi:hypothetical protein
MTIQKAGKLGAGFNAGGIAQDGLGQVASGKNATDKKPVGDTYQSDFAVQNAEANTRTRALPSVADLMAGWREDIVIAEAEQRAMRLLEPEVEVAVKTALADLSLEAQRVGVTPTEDEVDNVVRQAVSAVYEAKLKATTAPIYAQLAASAKTKADVVEKVLQDFAATPKKLYPFLTRVAQGDPAQLGKETVVWQNADFIVVAEPLRTTRAPKVLVVPKRLMTLPTELSPAEQAEIVKIGIAVHHAMGRAAAKHPDYQQAKFSPAPSLKINPPQWLSQAQIHMHVESDLPPMDGDLARYQSFFALVNQEMTRYQSKG